MAGEPILTSMSEPRPSHTHHDRAAPRGPRESYGTIGTFSQAQRSSLHGSSRSSLGGFSTHSTSSSGRSTPFERAPIVAGSPPHIYQSTENVTSYSSIQSSSAQQRDIQQHQLDQQQQQQQQRPKSPSDSMASHSAFGDGHPWYKRVLDKYGSLELDNKGSVARDHLALERTFLAWLRTSLAFASIGIAITQLFRLNTAIQQQSPPPSSSSSSVNYAPPVISDEYQSNNYNSIGFIEESRRLRSLGKPLGATFIGVAIVVLILGFHRYFQGQYWVVRGKFPASRGSVAIIAFIAGALMVSSLVVILAIAPGAMEA